MNIQEHLRRLHLFAHFSDEQIGQLGRCTSLVRYPEGAIVVQEGDHTTDAYLVEGGGVRLQRETPYGLYPLAELGAGDLFGEISFMDGSARTGDALITAAATLLPLNSMALAATMERDPRFTLALYWTFWKSLSRKLRHANRLMSEFFSDGTGPRAAASMPESATEKIQVELGKKQELFREQKLSPLEINFLSSLSKERKLLPGEELFREGETGDHLYVVLEGQVRISKNIPGAGEEALAIMERGDYFGEMALIDRQPRSADARAHDAGAVVLGIPNKVLEGILDIQKVSSIRLLKLLCGLVAKRLRESEDKLVSWFIFSGGSGNSLEMPEF